MSLDVYLELDPCEACGHGGEVYSANITHNLGRMAEEAGIYQHLWRPEEIGVVYARQLILPLTDGLKLLRRNPDMFIALNPSNGYGTYTDLVRFVESYLDACTNNPKAKVRVWK